MTAAPTTSREFPANGGYTPSRPKPRRNRVHSGILARPRIGACIRPEDIGVIAQAPPQRFVVTVDEAEAGLMYRQ